ncbi:AAEL004360-PA [Aedes aegypti]|uniref:AAEL004360-PA n=1 Tax=Aedes aegypti TaxID=7159 RepID=Q17D14_AEDAE|nr:AAEL004360-PA [Aedes aegypti]
MRLSSLIAIPPGGCNWKCCGAMNCLALFGVLLISHQFSAALLLKRYSCDNYVLSWCQLHNVTIQSDKDLQMVEFPKVQQIGFLNGSIPHFSHLMNLGLFKAGVLRIFARGTKISRLTLPNTIEQLYFRDNDITIVDIEPKTKYSMKYLRIHINHLRDVSNLRSLTNLIELNLCDNLIEHVSFDTFSGMTHLKQLVLCGNRIKTISTTLNINPWYFPRLGNFSLRDNLLTRLDVRLISERFTLLKILDLEHNSLDCETYQQLLKLVHQRKIIYNVDKRVCAIPPTIRPRFVPTGNELDAGRGGEGGDLLQQIRQLKERIYQQVKIINSQRIEIQQLRANLSSLMEQFDLVADTAQANDPF